LAAQWPFWWDWQLEFSPHVLKRMLDRGFSEVDLRLMMEQATWCHEDQEPGRWIVETKHDYRSWQVIVEPDMADEILVVVTAYSVEP